MTRLLQWFVLWAGFGLSALGQGPNTEVSLVLSHSAVRPGETVTAGLRMVSDPGWHTYWTNAGDAGMPASIEWQLPAGISAAGMEFPVPEKLVITSLNAYVYEGEVVLLIPLRVAEDAAAGSYTLAGTVNWLECSDKTCLPQSARVSATLAVGNETVASPEAGLIARWRERVPRERPPFAVSATWEPSTNTSSRPLVIEWTPDARVQDPDFYPFSSDVSASTEVLEASSNKVRLRKTVQVSEGKIPGVIAGVILNEAGKDKHVGYTVELRPAGGEESNGNVVGAIQLGDNQKRSLWGILGLAFLGGLILNFMPCVLPVIALKILGFVNQAHEEPRRIRELGIIYMLGVLASFLVFAGLIIGLKQATGGANWGFQMQNPYFVVGMTALVTLIALNLFGVFEITLGSAALGSASNLASREGRAGAFYNGILATLLATPCTAPALGAAVGAVITQPSRLIVITFLTIGFGLALPYVLLSWNPGWLKFLPKPGVWMEKFKMAMGFPMLATAVWLLSVGARHYGRSGFLWLGIFLVCVAVAAWIWGDFVQRGSKHRGWARALAAIFLLGGYFYSLEGKLHWREARAAETTGTEVAVEPGGIPWRAWSANAVEESRAAGHPVLIDFTADWCLTCQFNKTTSLEIDSVKQKLKETGTIPFLADFTVPNEAIRQELKRYGRAGVPLVVVLPADPKAAPLVLPELLTPGIVLEALDRAQPGKSIASK